MTSICLSYARGYDVGPFDLRCPAVPGPHGQRFRGLVWPRGDAIARADVPPGNSGHRRRTQAVSAGVGPKAAVSDYVRQEWQFALQADKAVTPVPQLGDYPLVPDELKLLHGEEFRDGAPTTSQG